MNVIADHELEKEITNPSKSVEKGKLPKKPNYKSKKISKRSQVLTNTKIKKSTKLQKNYLWPCPIYQWS